MGILYWLNPLNWFRKRAAAPAAPAMETKTAPAAPAKAAAPAKKAPAKKAPAKKAAAKPAATPAAKDYQPQCAALTSSGDQCRNSSRAGSKYCGSHKGYQPPSTKNVQKKKDTAPVTKKSADTIPGAGSKSKSAAGGQAQCAAVTASGKQCRNQSRDGSKYCASHKAYKHASAASKVKKADTKPRHAGAKDTKPSVRKS